MTEDMQPGEIERTLDRIERTLETISSDVRARHHRVIDELTKLVGTVGEHSVRLQRAETDLNQLGEKVETLKSTTEEDLSSIKVVAARQSAGAATLAFLASFIPWLWKH